MSDRTYSGARRQQFNLRERAVSDDVNRLQGFAAAAVAELYRRTHLASARSSEAGGKASVPSASGAPPSAIVFEGLCARPEIGTANLFVEAGALAVCLPAASPHPDDDPARVVRDPGVQVAGDLTLTPGAVSTRIDVVECQPYDLVQESDSRDVFDPATGTYAPVLLDKVVRGALAFRIRTGTPGGGFPGAAADWLPLAVAKVPSSATTWDDCDVWDVRPLLADLADPPHRLAQNVHRLRRQVASAVDEGAGVWRARGILVSDLDGFLLGGELAPTASGATGLTLSDSVNVQEPGFTPTASRPWYVFLLQPFGCVRWAKLSPASSGERTPQEPRGIPVLTQKAPVGLSGRAGTAIALPTGTGLGGSSTAGVAVLSGAFGAGDVFCGSTVTGDGWTRVLTPGIVLTPASGGGTATVTYNLTGAVAHPSNATAVRLRITTGIADAAGNYAIARVLDLLDAPAGNIVFEERTDGTAAVPSGGSVVDRFEVEVPIPPNLPGGAVATRQVRLAITWASGGSLVWSNQTATVVGWRLGD